jgi:phage shock protein PspC (stress-responsive transcriptional regulator)/signal transduction histidine kinase
VNAAAVSRSARFRRDSENGIVAGVLAGLARRLGVDPVVVRVGFVVAVIATGGLALVAYALAWAALPATGEPSGTRLEGLRGLGGGLAIGRGWRVAVGAALLMLAALLAFRELGLWWSDQLVWPLVLAAGGAALLWRRSWSSGAVEEARPPVVPAVSAAPRAAATPTAPPATQPSPVSELYRGGFGIALVVGAALLFLSSNDALGAARDAALTVVVVLVALALILAPFLWRLGRNLASERAERIRSQERAELAAHLHDSVLQTLTLMQKRPNDPRTVATLARRQERELRGWLSGEPDRQAGDSFTAALKAAAEEVEDAHGVAIEVVAVGDAGLDSDAGAVVAAAREALTNAAKFGADDGAPITVYAEAAEDRLQVFVHDRGPGFDPADVPADRRGVRESIVGRMERHGGRAVVRSKPGEGAEVELVLERSPR